MDTTLTSVPLRRKSALLQLRTWQLRKVERAKQLTRETIIADERRHARVRRRLATQHLSGSGLEIGALHMPLRAPSSISVRYVDRFQVSELRRHYPELDRYDIVEPDVIDDGEELSSIADCSEDFVIANHMIEHCEDPIGTLTSFTRVLRPGGVIYMAVPDCRLTFDRDRPRTPLSHIKRDHSEGPDWSRHAHYQEWARFIDGVPESDVLARAQELERNQYSIHFHVWTPADFLEMVVDARRSSRLPVDIEAIERNDHEFIVIMRRAELPDVTTDASEPTSSRAAQ